MTRKDIHEVIKHLDAHEKFTEDIAKTLDPEKKAKFKDFAKDLREQKKNLQQDLMKKNVDVENAIIAGLYAGLALAGVSLLKEVLVKLFGTWGYPIVAGVILLLFLFMQKLIGRIIS